MRKKNTDKEALLAATDSDSDPFVELGRAIGVDGLDAVFDIFGGFKPHIPYASSFWGRLERAQRNDEMRAKFTGHNHAALAAEYAMSEGQIRAIVNGRKHPKRRPPERAKAAKLTQSHYDAIAQIARDEGITLIEATTRLLNTTLASSG